MLLNSEAWKIYLQISSHRTWRPTYIHSSGLLLFTDYTLRKNQPSDRSHPEEFVPELRRCSFSGLKIITSNHSGIRIINKQKDWRHHLKPRLAEKIAIRSRLNPKESQIEFWRSRTKIPFKRIQAFWFRTFHGKGFIGGRRFYKSEHSQSIPPGEAQSVSVIESHYIIWQTIGNYVLNFFPG